MPEAFVYQRGSTLHAVERSAVYRRKRIAAVSKLQISKLLI
jgi:hypothetical protein